MTLRNFMHLIELMAQKHPLAQVLSVDGGEYKPILYINFDANGGAQGYQGALIVSNGQFVKPVRATEVKK